MVAFALTTSVLEVITASVIVVFAQVLNQPEVGQKYLNRIGLSADLSGGRMIFCIAITLGVVYLIKNIIVAAEVFYQTFSVQKMNYHFKNKLLHQYAKADYRLYLTRNSSFNTQIIGGDVEQMFSSGMLSIANILSECIIFFSLIGMIVYMNPSLALTVFVMGSIVFLGISKVLLPKFYQFGKKLQEAAIHSAQNLTQFFHAFKEIILLGKREFFIEAYQTHAYKTAQVKAMQTAVNALPRTVIEVLFVGFFVMTVVFLCLEHDGPVEMIGILGGYLYAGFRLMPGLNRIINQLNVFKSVIPSIERVYHEYTTISTQESYRDVPELQFNETIELSNVCFRYLNTKKDVLFCASVEIKKGECVGIVGETGSGKSTFVDLILGLLMPTEGSIIIDGKYPVNAYQWHQKTGYVPQNVYLTDDTVEANIAFGEKEVDSERLNAAIDAAQLRQFMADLPKGTKTIVGERGVRLSGGERQRIAIARALYREPEVLIFDEATSALDNETEARLMETIHQVSQNRTVIMIAHRLTTLQECDRIVVIEKGCIKTVTDYNTIQNGALKHA